MNDAWERFTTPRGRPATAEERRVLDRAETLSLRAGGELAGYAWGSGPSVCLAHGWGGHAGQLGAFVEPLVARGFRVLAVDMPAHGGSPGERTNLFEFARTLEAVRELFGPLHATIGHSLGAAATVLCAARGTELGRLVLVAATARLRDEAVKFARRVGLAEQALLARMEELHGATIWADTTLVGLAPRAAERGARVLVVHDELDREVDFADGAELARVWPGAELYATSGLGHVALLRSGGVVERVVGFVRE